MRNYYLLALSLFIFSCNQNSTDNNLFSKKRGVDLNKIDFGEKPLEILKDKIDSAENAQSSFVEEGYSAPFDYPEGYKFEPWNGKDSFYGKAYYSKTLDSFAYYNNLYFDRIAYLTRDNKVVAVLDRAEVYSDTIYNNLTKQLTKQFGKPSLEPQTTQDVAYEWTGKDRYVQIDYSKGGSITAMSNQKMEMKETFNIELLVFNKSAADEIKTIQDKNYLKSKNFKVLRGDFQLFKLDPSKNIMLADSLLSEKFKN